MTLPTPPALLARRRSYTTRWDATFVDFGGKWRQVGITSGGPDGCLGGGFYVRTDTFADWLVDHGVPVAERDRQCDGGDVCDGACFADADCPAALGEGPAVPPGDDDDDDNGGCQVTELDGDVEIEETEVYNPGNSVAVTTNNAALTAGPWDWVTRLGEGPWSMSECDWRGSTALLGYLDDDGNGYYEPSDPIGAAPGNPFILGIGDVSGIVLDLGDVENGTFSGTVTFDGAVGAADELHIGVFDTPTYDPSSGAPPASMVDPNPVFPYAFDFTDIAPGTYWIGAYLDIGGDDPTAAGPEDPEVQVGPFLLAPDGTVTGIEVPLPTP